MKLRALITIKYGGRYRGPGQVFNCDDYEVCQYLINQAAAEPIEEPAPDAGLTADDEVERHEQVSEPKATSEPLVTTPVAPDPEIDDQEGQGPAADPSSLAPPDLATWEKDRIREALDAAGVDYDGRLGRKKLLAILKEIKGW